VLWPDGSIHWIAGRWQVFMNDSGEPDRVVGANMDVTVRKQTEEALLEVNRNLEAQAAILRSREELLKIFVKSVPAGVAMLDRQLRYLQVSDRWCADYGIDSSKVLGRSHYELFPDVPQRWKEMHRRALQGETLRADEDRWDREGGDSRWVRWEIRPWRTPSGIVGGILIFAEDITHRKQMEEAISAMSRKLLESQEQERARIGRELHDDINQRLAWAVIELERWCQEHSKSEVHTYELIDHVRQHLSDLGADIQALSHRLHSSKLDYLGLTVAANSFCREFSEQQKVQIDFTHKGMPSGVPQEISLCLFRILQEALQNAVKYSGVRHFTVKLEGTAEEIRLTIGDSGAGFDQRRALSGQGLGLTSMRERMHLVNGELSITSQPASGTTVLARVPFKADEHRSSLAG